MYKLGYETNYFKDIFKDYNDFSTWYKSLPLSENELDVPSEKTYTLLFYEFADSHCAMDNENFKNHFAIDLYTHYKEFEETSKAISDLMKLTDKDISEDGIFITNSAEIPENEYDTNTETVNFTSLQQKTINKKGMLQIKREQLSNKRSLTTKRFLDRFRHLFIKILSPAYNYVVFEEDDR